MTPFAEFFMSMVLTILGLFAVGVVITPLDKPMRWCLTMAPALQVVGIVLGLAAAAYGGNDAVYGMASGMSVMCISTVLVWWMMNLSRNA